MVRLDVQCEGIEYTDDLTLIGEATKSYHSHTKSDPHSMPSLRGYNTHNDAQAEKDIYDADEQQELSE